MFGSSLSACDVWLIAYAPSSTAFSAAGVLLIKNKSLNAEKRVPN